MTCEDCIHNEVCYRREVCNNIEEHIRKLGCMDFIARADVVEVRHGKWLTWEEQFPDRKPTKKNNLGVFCNNCHSHADNMTDYCPNCGAKMDGDTE